MNWFKFLLMSLCGAMLFAACDSGSSSASSNGISTSVDQESPSSSVNQAYSSDSGTSEPAGIESSSSCALNEEIESSADVPASSEDVPLSSSEQSSSSVQESSSSLVDECVWDDNRGSGYHNIQTVKRFEGDSSDVQEARRTWLAVDGTIDVESSLDSLKSYGIIFIDTRVRDCEKVNVYLTKFEQDIPKTTLAEIIPGFFNSFNVDDTTKIDVRIYSSDTTNGSLGRNCCVVYEFWKDVQAEQREKIELECGVANGVYGVSMEVVECLASNKDILSVSVGCNVPL